MLANKRKLHQNKNCKLVPEILDTLQLAYYCYKIVDNLNINDLQKGFLVKILRVSCQKTATFRSEKYCLLAKVALLLIFKRIIIKRKLLKEIELKNT